MAVTLVTRMVKAITSRALMVGSVVVRDRDQRTPSTVPTLPVSCMVKTALLLMMAFHMVSQVITVGSTIRTALLRLLMVRQAVMVGSTVRLGVSRVLQGVWAGPQTGLLRLSGMVQHLKEKMQMGQTTATPPTGITGPFLQPSRFSAGLNLNFKTHVLCVDGKAFLGIQICKLCINPDAVMACTGTDLLMFAWQVNHQASPETEEWCLRFRFSPGCATLPDCVQGLPADAASI